MGGYIISIHAPTKGATATETNLYSVRGNFNPRSHEGSDALRFSWTVAKKISIHAPTKGATEDANGFMNIPEDFNPRSHEGSDFYCHYMLHL